MNATDTSRAAHDAIRPIAADLCARVEQALKLHGAMTADETAHVLRLSVLSIRPRFTQLRDAGVIHDTGSRRPNDSGRNAIVWALGRSTSQLL